MGKGQTINLSHALDIFSDHFDEIKDSLSDNIIHDLENREPWPITIDTDPLVVDVIMEIDNLEKEQVVDSRRRVIKRIVSRQQPRKTGRVTDQMIETAREYPIDQLFAELTGERPRHKMAHCPFHPDSTASLSLGKYNRFKCFGCDESGDTISLVMKLDGKNFIQAVRDLQ